VLLCRERLQSLEMPCWKRYLSPTRSDHKTKPLPQLAVSGHDEYDPEHNKSLLPKGVDKISGLLPGELGTNRRGRPQKSVAVIEKPWERK
jgi:hypothetical protein